MSEVSVRQAKERKKQSVRGRGVRGTAGGSLGLEQRARGQGIFPKCLCSHLSVDDHPLAVLYHSSRSCLDDGDWIILPLRSTAIVVGGIVTLTSSPPKNKE